MNLTEFKAHLTAHPAAELRFVLPDGDVVPAHFHITEVGRIDKAFIDCGGEIHRSSHCQFQVWVADDSEHRFAPGGLAKVIAGAAPLLQSDDLPVEIEYEDCSISQYPVESASAAEGVLTFQLGEKHTDCLAKSVCLPDARGVHEKSCC
jgi:hypothetical protein